MAIPHNSLAGSWYFETMEVGTFSAGNAFLANANVASNAAIATSKQVNRIQCPYAQADGSNVASTSGDGVAIYKCDKINGATIKKVSACVQDSGSGGSPAHNIEIDIQKYDYSASSLATILSSTVNITESEADYETVNGTISDSDMDQHDVLVVQVTVTGSGGTAPQGLFVMVEVDEEGS